MVLKNISLELKENNILFLNNSYFQKRLLFYKRSRFFCNLDKINIRFNIELKLSTLDDLDSDDPLLIEAMDGTNTLETSFGAYYYNDNGLYAGISAPNLIRTKMGGIKTNEVGLIATNLILFGGYKIKKSELLTLNPSVLVRQMKGGVTQLEING